MYKIWYGFVFLLLSFPAFAGSHYITIQQTHPDSKKPHAFVCAPQVKPCLYTLPIMLIDGRQVNLEMALKIHGELAQLAFAYEDEILVGTPAGFSTVEFLLEDLQTEKQTIELYHLHPTHHKDRVDYAVIRPKNIPFANFSISMMSPDHNVTDHKTTPDLSF